MRFIVWRLYFILLLFVQVPMVFAESIVVDRVFLQSMLDEALSKQRIEFEKKIPKKRLFKKRYLLLLLLLFLCAKGGMALYQKHATFLNAMNVAHNTYEFAMNNRFQGVDTQGESLRRQFNEIADELHRQEGREEQMNAQAGEQAVMMQQMADRVRQMNDRINMQAKEEEQVRIQLRRHDETIEQMIDRLHQMHHRAGQQENRVPRQQENRVPEQVHVRLKKDEEAIKPEEAEPYWTGSRVANSFKQAFFGGAFQEGGAFQQIIQGEKDQGSKKTTPSSGETKAIKEPRNSTSSQKK